MAFSCQPLAAIGPMTMWRHLIGLEENHGLELCPSDDSPGHPDAPVSNRKTGHNTTYKIWYLNQILALICNLRYRF
jgi:hypothetical protein